MSMGSIVDTVFREAAPSIFQSWFITAPTHPDDECVVYVVIRPEIISEDDRNALIGEVRGLFFVRDVEIADSMPGFMAQQAIRATCVPWNRARQLRGIFDDVAVTA